MSPDSPASQKLACLKRTIRDFAFSIAALTFGRIILAALALLIGFSGTTKDLVLLLIKITIVVYTGWSVRRLSDRVLRLMYSVFATLLIVLQLAYLSGYSTRLVRSLYSASDAVVIVLLVGIVYRLATLYAQGKEASETEFLKKLAVATSSRVGVDFLTDLAASIAKTLSVDCVWITEIDGSGPSEIIVASSGLARGVDHMPREGDAVDIGNVNTFKEWGVASIPITHSTDSLLGHICLLHENNFVMTERQHSTLLVFGSRAGAELERKRLDDVNSALEEKMLRVQKLESLGIMAGGIAHDFNNLLTAIRSNVDLIGKEFFNRTNESQHLRGIELAVERGASLCESLLAYAGCTVTKNRNCDINKLARDLDSVIRATSPAHAFDLKLTEKNTCVWGDVAQLSQALLNLMKNAVEACAEQPSTISIRTWTEQDDRTPVQDPSPEANSEFVFVEIADRGIGISPENVGLLFDPFYTTKAQGRGLGLAAVVGIVRKHGGEISVQSTVGFGSTFTVKLPMSPKKPERPERPEPSIDQVFSFEAKELAASKIDGRVLLVDDDPVVREATRSVLEVSHIHVVTAEDGHEAIRIFRDQGDVFETIVLDQTMPGMSGIETFRELRTLGATSRCVLISGYSKESLADCPNDLSFLAKPYSSTSLLDAVGATHSDHVDETAARSLR